MHREKLVAQWPRLGHVIIYAPACPHFCVVRAYIQLRIRYVGPLGRHALVHLCVCMLCMYACCVCHTFYVLHVVLYVCMRCLLCMSRMFGMSCILCICISCMLCMYLAHAYVCLSACLYVCLSVSMHLCNDDVECPAKMIETRRHLLCPFARNRWEKACILTNGIRACSRVTQCSYQSHCRKML